MVERPPSKDAHDIEVAKVTINENSVVIAMMLRIIARDVPDALPQLAPSIAAAS